MDISQHLNPPVYGFSAYGNFSNGKIPFQSMYALPASIENLGQSNSFRTLRAGEVFGDRVATLFIEHNFNDEIFRLLHLNFLIDWQGEFIDARKFSAG